MLLYLALIVLCNCFGERFFPALRKYLDIENYTVISLGLIQKTVSVPLVPDITLVTVWTSSSKL